MRKPKVGDKIVSVTGHTLKVVSINHKIRYPINARVIKLKEPCSSHIMSIGNLFNLKYDDTYIEKVIPSKVRVYRRKK